jgi:hypothetical protein
MLGAGEDISDCRSDLGVSEGRFCGAPPNSSLAADVMLHKLAAFLQPVCAGPSGVRVFGSSSHPPLGRDAFFLRGSCGRGAREMLER